MQILARSMIFLLAVVLFVAGCRSDTTIEGESVSQAATPAPIVEQPTVAPTSPPAEPEPVETDESTEASEADVAASLGVDQVDAVFEEYRQALLLRDGNAANQTVNQATFEYYDRVMASALTAGPADLDALPLSEALAVLSMRAALGQELLDVADGQELFSIGVARGLVGDNIDSLQIDRIEVNGDEALGYVQGVASIRFEVQDGEWRIDLPFLTSLLDENEANVLDSLGATDRGALYDLVTLGIGRSFAELSQPIS